MKCSIKSFFLTTSLLVSGAVMAQAPAGAPSGSTGLCRDGSYTSNATKKGACADHKGVKDWFAMAATATAPAKDIAASAPASASTAAVQPARTTPATAKAAPSTAPAAGGGPGQVWVNASTKVYHCVGDQVLRQDQAGRVHDGGRCKGGGQSPRPWKGVCVLTC